MHPSGHGTMCAFDALIAAPAKTLPECAALLGSGPGSGALARTLSVALQGVLRLVIFWRGRPGGAPRRSSTTAGWFMTRARISPGPSATLSGRLALPVQRADRDHGRGGRRHPVRCGQMGIRLSRPALQGPCRRHDRRRQCAGRGADGGDLRYRRQLGVLFVAGARNCRHGAPKTEYRKLHEFHRLGGDGPWVPRQRHLGRGAGCCGMRGGAAHPADPVGHAASAVVRGDRGCGDACRRAGMGPENSAAAWWTPPQPRRASG